MELPVAQIGEWVGQLLWPLIRVSAFVMVAPIVGAQLVSARIRVAFAVLLALTLAPVIPSPPQIDWVSLEAAIIVAQQFLIGVALAFILQVLLQILVMAGQIIAFQMGLGFASMVDPANGVSVAVVSQFYLMMVTLLFLASNGHLVMIEVLAESFYILPIGLSLSADSFWQVVASGSWLFGAAVLIALPAIASLLIVNCAMGVLTRSAPQLNIFAVGFPMTVLIGLGIMFFGVSQVAPHFLQMTEHALGLMRKLL